MRFTSPLRRHASLAHAAVWRAALLCAAAPAGAATFTTLYTIPAFNDSAAPTSALILVNGTYYGTASTGGAHNQGTVFAIDPSSGKETILHSFTGTGTDGASPAAPLILYNGLLYGTTEGGGTAGQGTVFVLDPSSGAVTTLCSMPGFPSDSEPVGALVAYNGFLYGTTATGGDAESGTVFKVDPNTGAETSLAAFGQSFADGAFPKAAMIVVGNLLYGTTEQGGPSAAGTIFSFDPSSNTETPVFTFNQSNGFPVAPLLQLGNLLYGTAGAPGGGILGSVFSFDPKTQNFSIVHAFTGGKDCGAPEAGLVAVGGQLFGTTSGAGANCNGSVYQLDPGSGNETPLYDFAGGYDGANPASALILSGTLLCGTAENGGYANAGLAFCVDPTSKTENVLAQFAGMAISTNPAPIAIGRTLYTVASAGGALGYGAIIAVDSKTGAGRTVYSFAGGPDGTYPYGSLLSLNNVLYGTTRKGGSTDEGTIFRFDLQAGTKTILHSFTGSDGSQPVGALTLAGNVLFGTTYDGGSTGNGTVYKIDPNSGQFTTVYAFTGGATGYLPWAPLILANNLLYGTTLNGGTNHNGTVYSIDPQTGQETTIYRFKGGQDGSGPFAPVTFANGTLYGTTSGFGTPITTGTIFTLDPAKGTEKALFNFTQATGDMPLAGVTAIGSTLYGATSFDGADRFGTLYSFAPATGKEKTLHTFTGGADGGLPQSSLLAIGHTLYGTTSSVGLSNAGTVFKLKP